MYAGRRARSCAMVSETRPEPADCTAVNNQVQTGTNEQLYFCFFFLDELLILSCQDFHGHSSFEQARLSLLEVSVLQWNVHVLITKKHFHSPKKSVPSLYAVSDMWLLSAPAEAASSVAVLDFLLNVQKTYINCHSFSGFIFFFFFSTDFHRMCNRVPFFKFLFLQHLLFFVPRLFCASS